MEHVWGVRGLSRVQLGLGLWDVIAAATARLMLTQQRQASGNGCQHARGPETLEIWVVVA